MGAAWGRFMVRTEMVRLLRLLRLVGLVRGSDYVDQFDSVDWGLVRSCIFRYFLDIGWLC